MPSHLPSRPPSSLDHLTPANILALQRTLGNRAVQRLLAARQPATDTLDPATTLDPVAAPDVERDLLSPAQVARAIGFYRAQPARYTPGIIKQIQEAVGTDPTGTITAVDVQAVAKRQARLNLTETPALKVDGMAGPRTLPSVFKIGLAKDDPLATFTAEAAKRWKDKTKSEEVIAQEVVDKLLTDRLNALDIPKVPLKILDDLGTRGAFSSGAWELKLDRLQFRPGPKHDLKATTASIYHEGRHAEQAFKVGQMLAGRKRTAAQINAETGLNLEVAKQAVLKPLAPGTMEAVIAEGWHDSLDSDAGIEARRRNSVELKAASRARDAAQAAFDKDPSPANAAKLAKAEARFDKAVAVHDDLPHEFDAERLEARVEKEFDKAP
jgi:hypothetical protein